MRMGVLSQRGRKNQGVQLHLLHEREQVLATVRGPRQGCTAKGDVTPGTAGVLRPSAWPRLAIAMWFLLPGITPTLARRSERKPC